MSNSDKNAYPDSHLMVTIATDKTGDIDQTDVSYTGSSKVPFGFDKNVLFAGRIFPYHSYNTGKILATEGKYPTSEPNYVNVAMSSLCFQLYAEVTDIDELLEMIRSTALNDYIRFDLNGDGDTNDICDGQPESQPLQLINPAGFIKKYLMPTEIPGSIGLDEIISLGKGYYKGVVFNIPGAEVKIGDEWISVTADNSSRIKAANPMDLEWRLNSSRLRKYGYSSGQTIEGKMLLVDDQWNGLRIEVPITVQVR